MGIQDSVNSMINQVATISTIGKVAKEGKELRSDIRQSSKELRSGIRQSSKELRSDIIQSSKDIKGSIESLKVDREQLQAYKDYTQAMTNPNIRKIVLSEQNRAVQNALMKERAAKFKQSLMERTQTLAKQKQDVPKIKEELRIGKEKISPDSPLYQKIMSQMEERDGK